MLVITRPIERNKFDLDKSKLEFHQKNLGGLEASLVYDDEGIFNAYLYLEGHGTAELGTWKESEPAFREYAGMIEKFKTGKYTLQVYTNGHLKVEFLK